jgi:epoxyqueuosine reductase
VPGAKSVVSVLYNYFPEQKQNPDSLKISKYAWGEDYHFVIKDKLKAFLWEINATIGEVHGRVFVDSAPVMDKAWAKKSGLGWVGKNSNLITRTQGSFFFLAELILDLKLEADGAIKDYCGSCTRCIDACPTEAIVAPYQVDGSRCISYFTIELKDAIPEEWKGKFDDWAFGCDICQDVCPWNRFSKPNTDKRFEPKKQLLEMKPEEWLEITDSVFAELFGNSAITRTGREGMQRNIGFLGKP